ncbi:MAG TPA: NrfD/PsrC family molybdoenzyme membrane anchor subunit [Gaiellaceae bacterium]|nr:NrfD/PsrC family molybdoenzyme membrane anchor subunit [Gaiellaceae bacterium]
MIKEPVWKPEIPFYFWAGGLAGAASLIAFAARLAGNEELARKSHYVATVGEVASPALLISDLGRPERFLNMLRVFKVTSPMSVGSWILAASGATTTAATALDALGVLPRVRLVAEASSALLGPALSTYTSLLIANTAVPVWHEARHELPFAFGASSLAEAGAAATMVVSPERAGPARRAAVAGALARLGVAGAMTARLGMVGEPYVKGAAGVLNAVSAACSAGGAALLARRGAKSRSAAILGSGLVLGGELAFRWSVFRAGFQSARDPKYTIVPQRARSQASTQA